MLSYYLFPPPRQRRSDWPVMSCEGETTTHVQSPAHSYMPYSTLNSDANNHYCRSFVD
jgi:hypothetical protein